MKITQSDFQYIMSEVYINCMELKDMGNKRNKKWFKIIQDAVEYTLYQYAGVEIEEEL